MEKRNYDLEDRLVQFGLMVMELEEQLFKTKAGNHVGGQLLRSGTSPAFNYGEAQVASSTNDFIHKMRICLKEIKETGVALKFVKLKPLVNYLELVETINKEYSELLAIFITSIETAKKNNK